MYFLSAQWPILPYWRWGLVPSCQNTSSEGWVLACSLPFICVLSPLSAPVLSPQRGVVFGQEGMMWTLGMGLGMSCGNPTTERDPQTKEVLFLS